MRKIYLRVYEAVHSIPVPRAVNLLLNRAGIFASAQETIAHNRSITAVDISHRRTSESLPDHERDATDTRNYLPEVSPTATDIRAGRREFLFLKFIFQSNGSRVRTE